MKEGTTVLVNVDVLSQAWVGRPTPVPRWALTGGQPLRGGSRTRVDLGFEKPTLPK